MRIAPGREKSLRSLLNRIGDDVEQSDLVPFTKATTVHFARWVVLPERTSDIDDTTFPAQLVLSTSYDETLDSFNLPDREKDDVLCFIGSLRAEIVEAD